MISLVFFAILAIITIAGIIMFAIDPNCGKI